MYIIEIYDKSYTFIARIEKFISLKVDNYINKECKASFSIPNIPEYSKIVLKKKNVVKIYRLGVKIFEGVILGVDPGLTDINVSVESYSHILKYRFLYTTYSGTIASVVSSIFTDGQNDGNIPLSLVTSLTGDINLDLTNKNLKSALDSIKTAGKEYFYGGDILYIGDAIGEDKTNIELKFLENRTFENNIKNVSIKEDAVEIINSVKGYKTGLSGSPIILEDSTSISDYGKYRDVVNFSEANDLATLTSLTQGYLDENKSEVISVDFKLLQSKIDANLFDVGDTVTVKIEKGYTSFNGPLRILGKIYNVSKGSSFSEEIGFSLSEGTKEIKNFFETISSMKNRISILEKK